jgi:hypothetical protein
MNASDPSLFGSFNILRKLNVESNAAIFSAFAFVTMGACPSFVDAIPS